VSTDGQVVEGLGRVLAVEVAGGDDLPAVRKDDLEGMFRTPFSAEFAFFNN
jgi:hypothetical protein